MDWDSAVTKRVENREVSLHDGPAPFCGPVSRHRPPARVARHGRAFYFPAGHAVKEAR